MTERARDKLEEMEFFLEKLREVEDDESKYYFSAFLSAGRSVTYFLQAEYSEDDEFFDWYGDADEMDKSEYEGTKQHELRNDPLTRVLKETRDVALHAHRPDRSKFASVTLEEGPSGSFSRTEEEYYFDTVPSDVPNDIKDDFWDEYTDTPITELCEEYANELKDLLSEWEELQS